MHGPGNYAAQVGRGGHVPLAAFQQHPGAAIATTLPSNPSSFHTGPPDLQVQVMPHYHTLPLPQRSHSFTHNLPGTLDQGPIPPVVSSGMNSSQSYSTHLPSPLMHGSAQTVNSYPTFEPRRLPWNQNVHQNYPSVPLPVPRVYQPPSSQGYAMERGSMSQHAPQSVLPLFSSASSFSMTDPFSSSARPMSQHANLHHLPPPPPPPPPPFPPSSSPGVLPLSPFSPPNFSKDSEKQILKEDILCEGDLISEHHTSQPKPEKDGNALEVAARCQSAEIIPATGATDATLAHSPADSDMDMEDDITLPDEEKHNCLSKNLNEGFASMSRDDATNDQLEASLCPGGHGRSGVSLDVKSLNTGSSVSQIQRLEADGAELSELLMGGANPFKLLLGYASDDSSENDAKSNLDGDADNGCNFTSELKPSVHFPVRYMIEPFSTGKAIEFSDKNLGDQESVKVGTFRASRPKDSSRCSNDGIDHQNQKPDIKRVDTELNVDEFGRLVREGVSDSDTNDSPRYGRRHARRSRRQSRSQSRSRSRDRRRRNSFRRNEGRHRSRSLSPRRQHSGSKAHGDRLRRNKGQIPECFDFFRGKCYRGAICRYSHHEHGQSERLRYNRDKKQYHKVPHTSRSPDFHAERNPKKIAVLEKRKVEDKGKLLQEMPRVNELTSSKTIPIDPVAPVSDKLSYLQSASSFVVDVASRDLSNRSSCAVALGNEDSLIGVSPTQILYKNPQLVCQQNKQMGDSLVYESSPVQASAAMSTPLRADKFDVEVDSKTKMCSGGSPKMEPYSADKVSSQSMSLNISPPTVAKHTYKLSLPLPSASHVMNAQFSRGIPQDYNGMLSTPLSISKTANHSSYQAPVSNQHTHIPEPSNSSSSSFHQPSWPPLQPQPLHTNVTLNATAGDCVLLSQQHVQQSLVPPRNGFSSYTSTKPYLSESLPPSQTGQYQAYLSAREADQRSHTLEEIRSSNNLNLDSVRHILSEDSGHSQQGMNHSNFVTLSQPKSLMNTSVVGCLPSSSNPSYSHPYLQSDYQGVTYPVACGVSDQLAKPENVSSSISRSTSEFFERNHPSYVADILGSRISNNYNPYVSTFDHPPSSQFSSNTLIQEKDPPSNSKYCSPFGLRLESVQGHKIGNVSSSNMISSSTSARTSESNLPRTASKQYDPLFDSIEPAPNSVGIADHQKLEINDNSHNFPIYNEEGGAIISSDDSPAIEEYGETADAGALVSGSPCNPNITAEMNAGEIEIDQVKESGKNKKGKDSRSMKLFKISVATFVKDVLKPSWRQGNMSKEAFKTIVKKTVDKVSSAMKSRKIPKSQAKINHYIDSSRGKLIKLVMGYVDKYVKA